MKKSDYSIPIFICLFMLICNAVPSSAQQAIPKENRDLITSACTEVNDLLTYIYEPSLTVEAKKKYIKFIKDFKFFKIEIDTEKARAVNDDYKRFTNLLILLADNALAVSENRLKRLDVKDGTKTSEELDEENKNLVFDMVRKIWDTEPYLNRRGVSYKDIFKFFSRR